MKAKVRKATSIAIGFGLGALLLVIGIIITFEIVFWDRVLPGVKVGKINLGGMSAAEARVAVGQGRDGGKPVTVVWSKNSWKVDPGEVGWMVDNEETVGAAMAIGRNQEVVVAVLEQLRALKSGVEVEWQVKYDETRLKEFIGAIAGQIDIPVKEPDIQAVSVNGELRVVVNPGRAGQMVDDEKLKNDVLEGFLNPDPKNVEVVVKVLRPKISEEQVKNMETRAKAIYAKKLILKYEDRTWDVNGEQLVGWMDPMETWQQAKAEAWASEFAHGFDKQAQNAFFRYTDGRVEEFKPGVTGVAVNQTGLTSDLLMAAEELENSEESVAEISIPTVVTQPQIKTEDVNGLGIKELIGRGESRFTGSIANRVFNIKKAAESLDGVLVAPGEEFSFGEAVGEISVAAGYKQGYIIKDGKTILGDGGGVCQVSSTMFRAALNAGLPIEERWAHAYRVSYYELDIGPGYDATIFTPTVDLKWKNDTPGYVLIQTKPDWANYKLAFELYGTSDGRKVEFSKTRIWDRVAPPPELRIDDPTLPRGVVKQTEHAIWGAKVAFDWTVTRGEEVIQKRTFYSNFQPWQAVYLVGTN